MRWLVVAIGFAFTAQSGFAQDMRPIHAYAALPSAGSIIPQFNFPTTAGGVISKDRLSGRPAVLAFWATWCHASREVSGQIQTLNDEYRPRGGAVIVLAANSVDELTGFFRGSNAPVVAAAGDMAEKLFDRSSVAPERADMRVEWALPLFLVVDGEGRVVARDAGPYAFDRLRATMNTLLPGPTRD